MAQIDPLVGIVKDGDIVGSDDQSPRVCIGFEVVPNALPEFRGELVQTSVDEQESRLGDHGPGDHQTDGLGFAQWIAIGLKMSLEASADREDLVP